MGDAGRPGDFEAGEVEEGSDCHRTVLRVTVEVSAGVSDTIIVHEGDSAQELAERFCERHGLQLGLVAPLRNHIIENLQRALPPDEVGGDCLEQGGSSSGSEEPATVVPEFASKPEVVRNGESAVGAPCLGNVEQPFPPCTPNLTTSRSTQIIRNSRKSGPYSCPGTPKTAQGMPRDMHPSSCRTPGSMTLGRSAEAGDECMPVAPIRVVSEGGEEITSHMPMQQRCVSNGVDDGSSRFEWLHQDASQRKFRLERLRRQVEHGIEDQHSRGSAQIAPGTLRCAAWNRCPEDMGGPGSRLYRDAAQRQLKIKHMQARQAEQRRQEEEQEATFYPAIQASQRTCQGVGRAMRDPEGLKTKTKIERMREMRQKTLLHGCTFKPEIDHKSEELMTQRLARMKISGNLYDALYEDALRRKERQFDAARALPPGVTFQPDIGMDHYRRPNDDTKEDFVNRLAYSKSYSERWLSVRRQEEDQQENCLSQDMRSQPEFHPLTGRGPLVARNKDHLPIGEFLYESGREKTLQVQAKREEQERSHSSTPKIGETSRQLFEEIKQRKYKDVFEMLVCQDSEKKLCSATFVLDGLDDELVEFLNPMIAYLHETGAVLDFDTFCAALDYQRQQAVIPTAHLFIQKNSARTSARYRLERDSEDFTPQTGRRSNQIAARHRPRGVPLHEQLLRERDALDYKLYEERLLHEKRQLLECTFQPNARSNRANSCPPRGRQLNQPSLSPKPMCRTPRTSRKNDPLITPIGHLSSDAGEGAGLATSMRTKQLGIQNLVCREQISQAEQAVVHCRTVVAMANDTVGSVNSLFASED